MNKKNNVFDMQNNTATSDGLQVFDSVQETERRYILTPYIPKRCVTLLQGDPHTAK